MGQNADVSRTSDPVVAKEVNDLLEAWRTGDRSAFDALIVLLHEELRRLAHCQFARERQNHTLQTHDLVSKLYLKMLGSQNVPWESHAHFLNAAVRNMRQILIDHGRRWIKRADGKDRVAMDAVAELPEDGNDSDKKIGLMLALNQAIEKMEGVEPAMAQIADLRLILGLTLEETARELQLPINKVKRDWLVIRKFLAEKVWTRYDQS